MIADYLSNIGTLTLIIHLLDILLVWVVVYKLLTLLKGTRGMQLVKGILIVIGLKIFFSFIGFTTMTYIFDQVVTWGVLGIMIIFQPELRRALEYIGRVQLSNILNLNIKKEKDNKADIISSIVETTRHMSRRRIGALLVLENYTGLDEYVESGIIINATVSNELIINIFIPNTPLHDGAMILNKDKIRAASCVLPLSDNRSIASSYGTRHRAALGLSELTDAIVVVVSEETGKISVCQNGILTTDFKSDELSKYLTENWLTQKDNLLRDKLK
ncbi:MULTISPECIES: diadenylate cyclase CdaA [Gemella]|uniref:diadenylate cyclase CdaA n=1 Tax=Gemella TaxID=1378 RepID=UPI0007684381|nr:MULTISPECIES: diadenylate cyclase CdaA [Gemella]AME08808.1 ABC transporter permease [Gemella sp. oral taxon 928]AXI26378.1 TIGR00159 family protein [Gemella sp. ND 6198]